jgi:hypothetical protein
MPALQDPMPLHVFGRAIGLAIVSALALSATPARATLIQVDWSAAVSGSLGTGTVYGTLGVFDVASYPASMLLPETGLTANVAFTYSPHGPASFFSGAYPQVSNVNDAVLEILSPASAELSPGASPNPALDYLYFDLGIPDSAKPRIFLRADETVEVRSTLFYSGGNQTHSATGPVTYTLSIVPEPASLLLVGSGAAWLAAARRGGRR